MLFNLSVENVALIEKAEINFNKGFNVLTGETGAGKSILIGSLNMLLGERMGRDIIRNGEDYSYVEGVFYLPEYAKDLKELEDVEIEEDGSLIVSRKLFSDGKNICKVGGRNVSVSALKEIGRVLINIHGQHDNQALLDSSSHIKFLDAAVGENDVYKKYQDTFSSLREEEKKLSELSLDENEKARRVDILTFEIEEIENANITVGEEEELKNARNVLKNKEIIEKSCYGALDALYENNEGVCAYNLLSQARDCVEDALSSGCDLENALNQLSDILYGLEDIKQEIRKNVYILDFGGLSLDETEERLDLIFKLKRKYGDSEEKILEYLKNAKDELDSITTSEERRLETEANIKKLTDDAIKLAEEIREIRTLTAEEIEKKIENELSELNMEGAKFSVSFEESELSPNGADKIEFLLSANKGEPLKPLSKIVSGGELSRIMLALKNVLFAGDVVDTLIFDEIDSGISGRAAGKVGAKLSEIAEKKQVLCVTHLPQIASLSQSHFKISKSEKDSKTLTTVKMLSRDERVSEIALMIGGDNVTETTLAQAEEMIK